MQSRPQQPTNRLSLGKKRCTDIHPLSSGKKALQNLKMHTNPSPARILNFDENHHHTLNSTLNSTHPQQTPQQPLKDSRVVIRQNELVQFTKKFAVEKADYQDRIDQLTRQLQSARLANSRIEQQFKTLLVAFKHKEHSEFQFVKEVQALKEELTRVAKDRSEQVDTQLQIEVTENLKLRQEIEQLRDILVRGNEEMRRLEASERESSRVIGERVFDIVKLSNQLEGIRKQLREFESEKQRFREQYQLLRQENQEIRKQLSGMNNECGQAQNKIVMLLEQISRLNSQGPKIILTEDNQVIASSELEQLRKQQMSELKRKVNFLEQQNQKLRQRIEQQSVNVNSSEVVHQNKALVIELNDRNKKIFDLSSQVGNLRKRIKSFSEENSPIQNKLDNQALIQKCCQLQSHIQTLNKRIISLQLTKQIPHFEDIAFSQINTQRRMPANPSISSLHPSSSSASNLDQLCTQNQAMKAQLDKLNQISAEHRSLQQNIRNMESLMEALRRENTQLKGGSDRKRVLIKRNESGLEEERDRLRDENDRLKEENQWMRVECANMQREMAEMRGQLNSLRASKIQKSINTLSLDQSRQDRISFLLKKIAEYSREIVADKDNPLQYELYGTIFNKFLKHIEALETQRESAQRGYSSGSQQLRPDTF